MLPRSLTMANGVKGKRRLIQPQPNNSPIITPMIYKAIPIPQTIIIPLLPAIAYLIGALGVKKSGSLLDIYLSVMLIHLPDLGLNIFYLIIH